MYNTVFLNMSVLRHELEFVSFEKKTEQVILFPTRSDLFIKLHKNPKTDKFHYQLIYCNMCNCLLCNPRYFCIK